MKMIRREHPHLRLFGIATLLLLIPICMLISAIVGPLTGSLLLAATFTVVPLEGPGSGRWDELAESILAVGIAVGSFPIVCSAFLLRDGIFRHSIRTAMKDRRECVCGYSLLGLAVEDGAVQCPECGDQIKLSDRNLTPEMLLAGELGAEESSR